MNPQPHDHRPSPAAPGGTAPGATLSLRAILELASLDALGLLEEDERRQFDASFRALPDHLREHVRREQARFADIQHMLPIVEPPERLRARVLAAVAGEAASEQAILGTLDASGVTIARSHGVSRLWRAVAIGSVAAVLGLGVVLAQMFSNVARIDAASRQMQIDHYISRTFGPAFLNDAGHARSTWVKLSARAGSGPNYPGGSLLINRASNNAHLVVTNLPEAEGRYQLIGIDPQSGARRVLHTFTATSGRSVQNFRFEPVDAEQYALIPLDGPSSEPLLLGFFS